MNAARRLPLAAAVGAVAALGFEPWGMWPFSIAGLAGLFWLVERTSGARGGFATGWAFGWGHFVVSLTWIATAFTYQAKMPAWLGWVAVVGLALFLALYAGLAVALTQRLARQPVARVLVLAAAWMAGEWLRGHLFTGFAWNPLGVAWLATPIVAQLASLVGGLGLSALMVLAGGTVWLGAQHNRTTAVATFGAICGFAVLASALVAVDPPASGPPIHLIQPNIGQGEKYDAAVAEAHLQRYLALTTGALARQPGAPPSLVVWPESSVLEPVEDDTALRLRLASALRPGDLLLFGGVAVVRDAQGFVRAVTNSLYVLDQGARLHDRYDKAHLVPLGEYVPLRPLMERLGLARLAAGDIDFAAGPGPATLALPGFPAVGAQICYEIIFPAAVVDARHRPAWLVNISNDAWFGPTGPPQHLAQARLRAIEEGLPVARATPTGLNALIDAQGHVLGSLPLGASGVVSGLLPAARPPTVFARFGHATSAVLGLLLLTAGLVIDRRRNLDFATVI